VKLLGGSRSTASSLNVYTGLMDEQERLYLETCLEERRCPVCRRSIPEGEGVGTGSLQDGLFCQLDCLATYHYSRGRPRLETELEDMQPDDGDAS
jgi:hypothetical protein